MPALGEIRDCDPPPVKTCFAVGAVRRVCEVFRFLLEHQSLGVTLVLLLLGRSGTMRGCCRDARFGEKQE